MKSVSLHDVPPGYIKKELRLLSYEAIPSCTNCVLTDWKRERERAGRGHRKRGRWTEEGWTGKCWREWSFNGGMRRDDEEF
jgi:hypothetical protein